MEILVPQIIYQVINFSVILGLLTYLLYKPILNIFKERSERIEEGQKAALKAIEEKEVIEAMKADTQKRLEEEEAKKMEAIDKEVKKKKQELMTAAQTETSKFLEAQEQKWQTEKERRVISLREELVDAVILASEKVVGAKLTKTDKQQLVDKQLDQVLSQL